MNLEDRMAKLEDSKPKPYVHRCYPLCPECPHYPGPKPIEKIDRTKGVSMMDIFNKQDEMVEWLGVYHDEYTSRKSDERKGENQ